MMSDEVDGPLDDPKVTQGRHRCIVIGILVVSALAIAAIVLPLVIDNCDCPSIPNIRITSAPTLAPVSPTTTPAPGSPPTPLPPGTTAAPTLSPAPSAAPSSQRLGQFIEIFLVPVSGEEVFQDKNSPQYRSAEFLADEDNIAPDLDSTGQLADRYALSTFYYAMDGDDSWFSCFKADTNCTSGNSWMDAGVDHCAWNSVTCNDEGRVIDLFFGK
jgi:hypothetical protein